MNAKVIVSQVKVKAGYQEVTENIITPSMLTKHLNLATQILIVMLVLHNEVVDIDF